MRRTTPVPTTGRPRPARLSERGSVSVFTIIVAGVMMALAGLCMEGGRVLNERATLADTAEQAARAGAQAVSEHRLRSEGVVVIDPASATRAVGAYLGATGQDRSWRVQITGRTVSVTMERDLPTTTLRLVGVDSIHVEVTGQARLAVGTRQEGDS